MPRAGVMAHNPFDFASGNVTSKERVSARFELRARLRNEIEALDVQIIEACRNQKSHLIDALTRARSEKSAELDALL